MTTATLEAPAVAPAPAPASEKLVIFAWSGELDRVWPTLILATTGAAMGKETTVFFTFWGLFPLVRDGVRITGENWMQKMLSAMHPGGIDRLKLTQMNFAGAGPAMMRHLAGEHHVASPHDLLDLAQEMGVHLVPCQMTMDMLGLKRADLIDGLDEPAGATSALAAAEGGITLFI